MRVLLVDDSFSDRRIIRRLAQRSDLDVNLEEVFDLNAAVKAIEVENFDCLIVDYHLPDGTGVGFVRDLAARTGRMLPPIVMLTSLPSDEINKAAMEAGVGDFLGKNQLTPSLFDRMLKNALLRRLNGRHTETDSSQSTITTPDRHAANEALQLLQQCPDVMAAVKSDDAALAAWRALQAFIADAGAIAEPCAVSCSLDVAVARQ